MTDAVQGAIIAAVPGILAVLVGLHNRSAIREVHLLMNSRLDELVKAAKDSGRIAERNDQRDGEVKP